MIKIESADSSSTIVREGETCILFPGMIITAEEVETITANGDVVYTIDESIVVVVPKGEKATVSVVPVAEPEAPVETPAETPAEAPQEAAPAETPAEAPQEAAPAEVVTETVEAPAKAAQKK